MLVPLMRPSTPDKKSFSMVSLPILAWSNTADPYPLAPSASASG